MRHTLSELTGPVYGHETMPAGDNDLITQHKGEPLGERPIVYGHVFSRPLEPNLSDPDKSVRDRVALFVSIRLVDRSGAEASGFLD